MNSNMVTLLLIVLLSISTYIEATKESKITEKVNLYPARLNNNQLDFNEKAQHIYITIYYYTKAANELLANAFEVSTDYTINPTQGDVLPSNGINKNESFHKLYQSLYFYSSCTLLLFLSRSESKFWLFFLLFVVIKPKHVKSQLQRRRLASEPTNAPTPFCVMLNVTVDANHTVNTTEFDGLYMYAGNTGNYPKWETPGGAGSIQYFDLTYWYIWGRSGCNSFDYESTSYFPPVNDANSEWYYSDEPYDLFRILIECIGSHSPTIVPTKQPTSTPTSQTNAPTYHPTTMPSISPSIQTTPPTNNPTRAPTPLCLSLYVTVIDANSKFDDNAFNGLYTLSDSKLIFDRPVWEAEADTDDQSVQYFAGSYWIIKGIGDINILSHSTNDFFPPINDINAQWVHSQSGNIFHVSLHCSDSLSPTSTPTIPPTNAPSHNPTSPPTASPTTYPSLAPSIAPTDSPTYSPTQAPTHLCLSLYVTVLNTNTSLNVNDFNGLYRLIDSAAKFNRPKWINDDKTIEYFAGLYWVIKGIGDMNILSCRKNDNFPPINNTDAEWRHPELNYVFHVLINCIDSFSPTPAPSFSPSKAPSLLPTFSPITPTLMPSVPSTPPTIAPSISPTFTPTFTPSNSPTSCLDYGYNSSYYSMDGYDYIYHINVSDTISNLRNKVDALGTDKVMKYIAVPWDSYNKETIQCNKNKNAYLCFVDCPEQTFCDTTVINIPSFGETTNYNLKELDIICTEMESCKFMNINVMYGSILEMSLFCVESLSCSSLKINISRNNMDMDVDVD
eukprot:64899_1